MAGKQKEDSLTVKDKLKAALVPESEQPYPIPENWVWTKFDICFINRTSSDKKLPQKYYEEAGQYPVVDQGQQLIGGYTNNKELVFDGQLPVVIFGDHTRCVKWIDFEFVQGADGVKVFQPTPKLNPKFLYYWMTEVELPDKGYSRHSKFLRETVVPIPPLPEQQRIAKKLESLLGKIKEAKVFLDEIPQILQNFRQTVLAAACSGRLTADWRKENPKVESAAELLKRIQKDRKRKYDEACRIAKEQGTKKPQENYSISVIRDKAYIPTWAEAKLDNLIYIAGRIGWRGLKAEEYTEDGPLFLSVYSLNYGEEVDFRDAFHISKERYAESPEIQLQENDILLAKDGAGIGKIGIVNNLNQLATVNSSLLVIRCQEAFIPKFLFYFLSGPQLQDIAKTRITGSATPHLFQRDIREFVLSIPPLAEQEEIVARVESLFFKATDLEAQYKEAMELIETLPEIILSKTFRGELVPQDPNDEPAFGLLERITFEKEKHETEKVEGTKRKKHKQNL